MTLFADRSDAGRQLAAMLEDIKDHDVVVVGLPRGGVPVAHEVAKALGAPLDVIVVRKLGVPMQPELGMGAIAECGVRVIDRNVQRRARVSDMEVEVVEEFERAELERRTKLYRGPRPRIPLAGCTVVVVDDGIAVGSTAKAACRVARKDGAAKVILAVPVAPLDAPTRIGNDADELIAVRFVENFGSVGYHYRDFSPTSDGEVVSLLQAA